MFRPIAEIAAKPHGKIIVDFAIDYLDREGITVDQPIAKRIAVQKESQQHI